MTRSKRASLPQAKKVFSHSLCHHADKMKMIDESEEGSYEFVVNLTIKEAKLINNTTTSSSSVAYNWIPYQIYYVVASISPENIKETPLKFALSADPKWNLHYDMLVDRPIFIASLRLEVIRVGFQSEIGTSTGQIVVGKVEIPLSKLMIKGVHGFIDLVKLDGTECRFQGSIDVHLELEKRRKPRLPSPPKCRALKLTQTGTEGIGKVIEIIDEPDQDHIQGDDRIRRRRRGSKN